MSNIVKKWQNLLGKKPHYIQILIPLLLFGVALMPRILALSHFMTVDEPAWINRSARFLLALISHNIADIMDPKILDGGGPGITTMWLGSLGLILHYIQDGEIAANGLIPFLEHYTQPINEANILPMARILTILLASLLAPAMYLGLKNWLGRPIALVGALLLAFDPFFMAHSRVLHHDALVTIFMALSLMWILTSLWHRHAYLKVVLSGFTFTLALLSKLMGGFLVPFYLLLFILAYFWSPIFQKHKNREPLKKLFLIAGVWSVSAFITFVIFSPGIWVDPITYFDALFLRGLGMAEKGHIQFFLGTVSSDPGALLYPIAFLFRTTPIALLGFLLSLVTLKQWDINRKSFVRLIVLFIVLFSFFLIVTPKKQERYILPIFPWVDFLAATGWVALAHYLSHIKNRYWNRLQINSAVLIGLVLLQFGLLWSDYPYYFSYYNPLFGGATAAGKTLLVGWGEGLDEAGRYLDQKPDAQELVISAVPALVIRPYFSGHVLDFYDQHSALWADYVVTYINQFQRDLPSKDLLQDFKDLEREYIVTRHGLPYAYIYRGARFADYEIPEPQNPTDLNFDNLSHLIGFDDITPVRGTGQLQIRLYWKSLQKTATDFTWSLRLVDHENRQWSQLDTRPMAGVLPTNLWRPGSIVISDNQTMELPVGMPPGDYELRLQVYSAADMKVLPVEDAASHSTGTTAYLGTISIPRQDSPNLKEKLSVQQEVNQNMAQSIRLTGYDISGQSVSPGEELQITLYWEALEDAQESYQINLELLDETGQTILSAKEIPHGGKYPTQLWTKGEIIQDRHDLSIPADLTGGAYHLRLSLWDSNTLRGQTHRSAPTIDLGQIEIEGRPHYFEIPSGIQRRQSGTFNHEIELLGFDLDKERLQPGEAADLTLYWRALDTIDSSYQVFVHAMDSNLTIRGQHDSIPGQGALATDTWLIGEILSDTHPIILNPEIPEGVYTIAVGFYEPDSGRRLNVTTPARSDQQDYIVLELPIHVQR